MGGGLESRCVGRVYVADGAVRAPSATYTRRHFLLPPTTKATTDRVGHIALKHYRVNSKSDVNFHVALKRNRAQPAGNNPTAVNKYYYYKSRVKKETCLYNI